MLSVFIFQLLLFWICTCCCILLLSSYMLLILVVIIYLILLDELVMSSAQRRFGPFNIGVYGLLASIINGVNLLLTQSFFIMSSYSFIMFLGPLIFLLLLLSFFSLIVPLFIIDIFYMYFLIILLSSLLIFVYYLLAYSSFSKYSIIGSYRIVIQFLAFGLVFDCILAILMYVFSFLSFNLLSLYLFSSTHSTSSIINLSITHPSFFSIYLPFFFLFPSFSIFSFLFSLFHVFYFRRSFVHFTFCFYFILFSYLHHSTILSWFYLQLSSQLFFILFVDYLNGCNAFK